MVNLGPQHEPGHFPRSYVGRVSIPPKPTEPATPPGCPPMKRLQPNPENDPIAALLPEDREWLTAHGWVPERKSFVEEYYTPQLISPADGPGQYILEIVGWFVMLAPLMCILVALCR